MVAGEALGKAGQLSFSKATEKFVSIGLMKRVDAPPVFFLHLELL
jgi:hypothetical protein